MKNKIFLLTALLIAGFAADAAAQMARSDKTTFVAPKQKTTNNASQGITWSVRTGLNVSNIINLEGMDYRAKAGFHLGVLADIPVPMAINGFSVQSGLFYTMRGAKYKESENEEGYYKYKYTEKIASHYFQIPVYWSYKYDFGSVAVSAFTGPYIAVGLGGKFKWKEEGEDYDGESYEESEKYDLFGKDKDDSWNWKRFDFGWSLGAGVTFDRIYVGLQYDFGFINMERESEAGYHPKNRNFSLSVGYSF